MGFLDRLFPKKNVQTPPQSTPTGDSVTPSIPKDKEFSAPPFVKEYWEARGDVQLREIIVNAKRQNPQLGAENFAKLVILYGKKVLTASKPPIAYPTKDELEFHFQWNRVQNPEVMANSRWYFHLLGRIYPEPQSQIHVLAYAEAFAPYWDEFILAEKRIYGNFKIQKIPMLESSFKHLPVLNEFKKLEALCALVNKEKALAPWLDYVLQSVEITKILPIVYDLVHKDEWKGRKEINKAVKAAFQPQDSYSIARTLSAMENLWIIESKKERDDTYFRLLWA